MAGVIINSVQIVKDIYELCTSIASALQTIDTLKSTLEGASRGLTTKRQAAGERIKRQYAANQYFINKLYDTTKDNPECLNEDNRALHYQLQELQKEFENFKKSLEIIRGMSPVSSFFMGLKRLRELNSTLNEMSKIRHDIIHVLSFISQNELQEEMSEEEMSEIEEEIKNELKVFLTDTKQVYGQCAVAFVQLNKADRLIANLEKLIRNLEHVTTMKNPSRAFLALITRLQRLCENTPPLEDLTAALECKEGTEKAAQCTQILNNLREKLACTEGFKTEQKPVLTELFDRFQKFARLRSATSNSGAEEKKSSGVNDEPTISVHGSSTSEDFYVETLLSDVDPPHHLRSLELTRLMNMMRVLEDINQRFDAENDKTSQLLQRVVKELRKLQVGQNQAFTRLETMVDEIQKFQVDLIQVNITDLQEHVDRIFDNTL